MAVLEDSYDKLVELFLSGSDISVEMMLREHEAKLYNLALFISGSFTDAEDVLLEVFLQAREESEEDKSNEQMRVWLYRTTVAVALRKREEQRSVERLLLSKVFPEPTATAAVTTEGDANNRRRQLLEYSVSRLPEAYKTVFLLADVHGFTKDGIAEVLSLDLDEVKARLHRARLMLRRSLMRFGRLSAIKKDSQVQAGLRRSAVPAALELVS